MYIHFIGIGGIGVSALAKFYFFKGHKISGSDLVQSEITDDLGKRGVKIYIGHNRENLPKNIDLVIYSNAVLQNNPELLAAKKSGIKIETYAQALGKLTKKYFTIAISGTHGKSTTTAMIALILEKAGLDPTVIIGTKLKEWGNSNFRLGKGKYLIIEADEYKAAFLNYWPKIIILTNIEEEHLDYYKNLKQIISAFRKYIGHLPKNGILVVNTDDFVLKKYFLKLFGQVFTYSFIQSDSRKLSKILKVPGKHNISNALAALTVARVLKIPDKISLLALSRFRSTWRRFEYRKKYKGAWIFDDYGHHPTEVRVTLQGAKEFMKNKGLRGKLWCFFQPHHFERLRLLFDDFVKAFDQADKIIILKPYEVAGREKEDTRFSKKYSSKKLVGQIAKRKKWVRYFSDINHVAQYLRKNLKKGDLAILMGAGDIYKIEI